MDLDIYQTEQQVFVHICNDIAEAQKDLDAKDRHKLHLNLLKKRTAVLGHE